MGKFNEIRWRFPSYKHKPQPERSTMEGGFETEYEQDLLAAYKDLIDLDIHRWVGMVERSTACRLASLFLCLDAYFLEARLLGLRLEFASAEDEESEESEDDMW